MLPIGDNVKKLDYGWMIRLIIIANILVTYRIFNLPLENFNHFLEKYSLTSSESLNVFDFLKKAFASTHMHGSYLHLWYNMWFLFVFGVSVENAIGPFSFAALYYGSGIAGWILYYFLTRSDLPAVGSSGAVSGVMAAYLILFPRAKILSFWLIFWIVRLIYVPSWIYIGIWAISQVLAMPDKSSGIAYEAHIGGIIFGLLFGIYYKYLVLQGKDQTQLLT